MNTIDQELLVRQAIKEHQAGQFDKAAVKYLSILKTSPNNLRVLCLLGLNLQDAGDHQKAVETLLRASDVDSKQALIYFHLGISFGKLGNSERAISSYKKALELNPGYVEALCNLGNVLSCSGSINDAISNYLHAIEIAPESPQIHYNLGTLYLEQFQPEKAIPCFRKAVNLKPDYAAAHNSLGVALTEVNDLSEAVIHYRQAKKLDPQFVVALFNLHSVLIDLNDLSGAIDCLEETLRVQPGNDLHRFFLWMIQQYLGNLESADRHFIKISDKSLIKAEIDSWNYLRDSCEKMPTLVGTNSRTLKLALSNADLDGLVLEFGVYNGKSIRQIASIVGNTVHGFDSFEGIPEEWNHEPKGSYSTQNQMPEVPANVILHKGWFEDSIPLFLAQTPAPEPIRFMNIDCDLYSSTKIIFDLLWKQIVPGTVIVFDEYIGYASWREDEFRAFNEAVEKHHWQYDVICFSFVTKQVAIKIK
ncbi:MAG: tetratricopeptide repeat protein [Azonexus sp.]